MWVTVKMPTRRWLDEVFPTAVRYMGLALTMYIFLVDHAHNPALIPLATGMVLYKTIAGNGKK